MNSKDTKKQKEKAFSLFSSSREEQQRKDNAALWSAGRRGQTNGGRCLVVRDWTRLRSHYSLFKPDWKSAVTRSVMRDGVLSPNITVELQKCLKCWSTPHFFTFSFQWSRLLSFFQSGHRLLFHSFSVQFVWNKLKSIIILGRLLITKTNSIWCMFPLSSATISVHCIVGEPFPSDYSNKTS